jgi:RHS repeat-associated protein
LDYSLEEGAKKFYVRSMIVAHENTSAAEKVLIGNFFALPNGNYYPFGKVSREGNSANEPKEGYTGYQHDVEMDLDYAGARFYNTGIGRFISVDPLASAFPSWTSYNYANNNPINLFDPTGLAADSPGVTKPVFVDPYSDEDIESQTPGNPADMPIFNPELDDQNENNASESEDEPDTPTSEDNDGKKKKKRRILLKPYTEEQINEALSWWGPAAITKGPKLARGSLKLYSILTAFFKGVDNFNLSPYAIYRMMDRGLTIDQVADAIRFGERFTYWQKGKLHSGFYNSITRILVATESGRIINAIDNVKPGYVQNLKMRKP